MKTYRRIAVVVGLLYLMANIAGPIGYGIELPILDAPDYLANIAANDTNWLLGGLLELVMAVGVGGISIVIYPVLRKQSPTVAIGYIVARTVEVVIYVVGIISMLSLLTLGQEYVAAGMPDGTHFQTIGELLQASRDWGGHVVLDVAVFPLAALMLNAVLYRARLVPRLLSGLGLVSAVLYWAAGVLVMFDLIVPLSTPHIILQAPLGIQEMLFALWLIVKGFNTEAVAAE